MTLKTEKVTGSFSKLLFSIHTISRTAMASQERSCELPPDLLTDEVTASLKRGFESRRHSTPEPANGAEFEVDFFLFFGGITGIDAETAFFVDIRVAHSNYNGID